MSFDTVKRNVAKGFILFKFCNFLSVLCVMSFQFTLHTILTFTNMFALLPFSSNRDDLQCHQTCAWNYITCTIRGWYNRIAAFLSAPITKFWTNSVNYRSFSPHLPHTVFLEIWHM